MQYLENIGQIAMQSVAIEPVVAADRQREMSQRRADEEEYRQQRVGETGQHAPNLEAIVALTRSVRKAPHCGISSCRNMPSSTMSCSTTNTCEYRLAMICLPYCDRAR